MSFTFAATQSMPTVSQRRISFATRTFVPTESVHIPSPMRPMSTKPAKWPFGPHGAPTPRRRNRSCETRARTCAPFASMSTPASAYVRTMVGATGRAYLDVDSRWLRRRGQFGRFGPGGRRWAVQAPQVPCEQGLVDPPDHERGGDLLGRGMSREPQQAQHVLRVQVPRERAVL